MSEKIIPQDGGTGLDTTSADSDWAAAAAVAALAAQGQSPFVVSGFGFTVDGTNDEITVAEGQALLEETDLSDGRTTEMNWLVGAFPVRHPGETVTLYPDTDTDVYLDADIKDTAPDTLSIVSVDSEFGTPPDEPRLLLGTVHADESVTLENRIPSFDQLAVESPPTDPEDAARKTETDAVQSNLDTHEGDSANPHATTLEGARAENNQLSGAVDANDNDIQNAGAVDASEAAIDRNRSIERGTLDFTAEQSAVADDGTWYAIEHPAVYRADGPLSGWTQVGSLPGDAAGVNNDLHLTDQGTLLTSNRGNILRSTDSGESWSAVQALTDATNRLWTITQGSDGSIYASEYQTGNAVWQSTDDGATWTQWLDGTDLPWNNHVHKIRVAPSNPDWIAITGGDGDVGGYYRTTDGGSTWGHLYPVGQDGIAGTAALVGVCFDPTDETTIYFGTDNTKGGEGIVKVNDDGASATVEHRQTLATSPAQTASTGGSFTIRTVDTVDGYCFVSSSVNEDGDEMVWASVGDHGTRWRALSPVGNNGWRAATTSQGAGETNIDATASPYLLSGDTVLSLHDLHNPLYGFHRNNYIGRNEYQEVQAGGGVWYGEYQLRTNTTGELLVQDINGNNILRINQGNYVRIGDDNGETIEARSGVNIPEFENLIFNGFSIAHQNDLLAIKDSGFNTIARFDQNGNLELAGSVTENVTF